VEVPDPAARAVITALNGTRFQGRNLTVNRSTPRQPETRERRLGRAGIRWTLTTSPLSRSVSHSPRQVFPQHQLLITPLGAPLADRARRPYGRQSSKGSVGDCSSLSALICARRREAPRMGARHPDKRQCAAVRGTNCSQARNDLCFRY
jgi:RNA recognition motif-containing protein